MDTQKARRITSVKHCFTHENMEGRAPNATFADDFMRANDRAELTPSHDAHGDTEFRYTVRTEGDFRHDAELRILAESVGWDGKGAETIFNGTVREFVDKFNS